MYSLETLIKKSSFNRINWIMVVVSCLQFLMYLTMKSQFVESQETVLGLTAMYLLFLLANFALMVINAKRLETIINGQFIIYKDYSVQDNKNYWVIEDEYFIIDVVPEETEFDEFMKSKLLR